MHTSIELNEDLFDNLENEEKFKIQDVLERNETLLNKDKWRVKKLMSRSAPFLSTSSVYLNQQSLYKDQTPACPMCGFALPSDSESLEDKCCNCGVVSTCRRCMRSYQRDTKSICFICYQKILYEAQSGQWFLQNKFNHRSYNWFDRLKNQTMLGKLTGGGNKSKSPKKEKKSTSASESLDDDPRTPVLSEDFQHDHTELGEISSYDNQDEIIAEYQNTNIKSQRILMEHDFNNSEVTNDPKDEHVAIKITITDDDQEPSRLYRTSSDIDLQSDVTQAPDSSDKNCHSTVSPILPVRNKVTITYDYEESTPNLHKSSSDIDLTDTQEVIYTDFDDVSQTTPRPSRDNHLLSDMISSTFSADKEPQILQRTSSDIDLLDSNESIQQEAVQENQEFVHLIESDLLINLEDTDNDVEINLTQCEENNSQIPFSGGVADSDRNRTAPDEMRIEYSYSDFKDDIPTDPEDMKDEMFVHNDNSSSQGQEEVGKQNDWLNFCADLMGKEKSVVESEIDYQKSTMSNHSGVNGKLNGSVQNGDSNLEDMLSMLDEHCKDNESFLKSISHDEDDLALSETALANDSSHQNDLNATLEMIDDDVWDDNSPETEKPPGTEAAWTYSVTDLNDFSDPFYGFGDDPYEHLFLNEFEYSDNQPIDYSNRDHFMDRDFSRFSPISEEPSNYAESSVMGDESSEYTDHDTVADSEDEDALNSVTIPDSVNGYAQSDYCGLSHKFSTTPTPLSPSSLRKIPELPSSEEEYNDKSDALSMVSALKQRLADEREKRVIQKLQQLNLQDEEEALYY